MELRFDHMDRIKKQFSRVMTSGRRILAVGGSTGPSSAFLPRVAARFRQTHGKTEVALRVDTSVVIEDMLRRREVEIGVITNNSESPDLVYERCRSEEFVFFMKAGSRLVTDILNSAELENASLIIFKRGKVGALGTMLTRMQERGIPANIGMRCESVEAVKAAVRVGTGVGLLYGDAVASEIERGEFDVVRVPGLEMRIDSFVVYRRGENLSRDAEDFLAFLRSMKLIDARTLCGFPPKRPHRDLRGSPIGRILTH